MRTAQKILTLLNTGGQTLDSYLQGFVDSGELLLWFDGTLDGAALLNKGSAGTGQNGTRTDVTITDGAMVFNGNTSRIDVTLGGGLNGANQEWVFDATPTDAGEGNTGLWFQFGFTPPRLIYASSGATINWILDYDTTDALVTLDNDPHLAGRRLWFFSHNSTSKVNAAHNATDSTAVTEFSYVVNTTGVGSFVAPVANLVIGNNSIGTVGWNGTMRHIMRFNRPLTSDERTTLRNLLFS